MSRRRQGLRAQLRAWNHASREIARAAEASRYHETMGRRFRIVARFLEASVGEANAWMQQHPRHGVLAVTGVEILIAHVDDEGEPIARAAGL